jgi:CBS domain-containing protein
LDPTLSENIMRRSAIHLRRLIQPFPRLQISSSTKNLPKTLGSVRRFVVHPNENEIRAQARDEHLHQVNHVGQQSTNSDIQPLEELEVEEKPRRLRDVPISEVLKAKHTLRWVEPVISRRATVADSIQTSIDNGLSGMMVIDDDASPAGEVVNSNTLRRSKVVGMITSRDLLRIMNSGLKHNEDPRVIMNKEVGGESIFLRRTVPFLKEL